MKISGSFEVKVIPLGFYTQGLDGVALGRMSIEKQFNGALEATSKGEMLSAMRSLEGPGGEGSGGYVALRASFWCFVRQKGQLCPSALWHKEPKDDRATHS
jgi:hypothetical protein